MASWPDGFLDQEALQTLAAFSRLTSQGGGSETTYAIGDIHGCADLLMALLESIRLAHPAGRGCKLIFLGDLVDRGPSSATVVATVRKLEEMTPPGSVACLKGNHEQLLIDWFRSRDDLWFVNGGGPTMESFNLSMKDPMPEEILTWIENLPTWREDPRHIFVHAGLRPDVPNESQSDQDRLWIREGFLDRDFNFGKHVVHGHTPFLGGPERRPFRTNIDTGAVYGGALTAAVLDETSAAPIGFLQAPAQGGASRRRSRS
jgi:serine/threonine protein phosphatase 1